MKKIFKRIVTLMLSFVMVFGLIPFNIYAIDVDTYSIELKDSVTGNYVHSSELKHNAKIDLFFNGEYQTTYDDSYMYPNYSDLTPGKETLCVIGPILLPGSSDVKYKSCELYPSLNMTSAYHTAQSYFENNSDFLSIGAEKYSTDTDLYEHFIVIPVVKREVKKLDSHTIGQIDALADLYNLNHKEAEEFVSSRINRNDFKGDKEFLLDFYKNLYGATFYNAFEYDDIAGTLTDPSSLVLMDTDEKELDKKAKLFTMFLSFSEVRDLGDVTNGVVGVLTSTDIHNYIKTVLEEIEHEKDPEYVDGTIFNTFITNFKDLYDAYLALCTDQDEYVSPIKETLLHLDLEDEGDTPLFNGEVDRFSHYMEEIIVDWCTHGANECSIDDLVYCMKMTEACNEEIKLWASENTSFDEIIKEMISGEYGEKLPEVYAITDAASPEEENKIYWKMITRCICDMQLIAEASYHKVNLEEYKAFLNAFILYDDFAKMINVVANNSKTNYRDFDALIACILEILPDYISQYDRILRQNPDDTYTNDYYKEIRQKLKDEVTPKSSSKKYKATDTKDTAEKISGTGKKGSKRTIVPEEGRKVANVVVTDKDGNEIEVTMNEDGTYSFVQPASNVNVEVTYKNREITLNIGSTIASVDGENSNLDACPVIRNDRTMLPIRFIAENLGAKVEWDEKKPNDVVITRGDTKIEITLGSDIMKVNGSNIVLDSVAFAENDRTYLPVRAVSEALNAYVEWHENEPSVVKIFER